MWGKNENFIYYNFFLFLIYIFITIINTFCCKRTNVLELVTDIKYILKALIRI